MKESISKVALLRGSLPFTPPREGSVPLTFPVSQELCRLRKRQGRHIADPLQLKTSWLKLPWGTFSLLLEVRQPPLSWSPVKVQKPSLHLSTNF